MLISYRQISPIEMLRTVLKQIDKYVCSFANQSIVL